MYAIEKTQYPYFLKQFKEPRFEWTCLVNLPYCALWRVMEKEHPHKVYYVRKRYEVVYSIDYGYLNY